LKWVSPLQRLPSGVGVSGEVVQGHAKEAAAAYEQALAIDPACLEALRALPSLRPGK